MTQASPRYDPIEWYKPHPEAHETCQNQQIQKSETVMRKYIKIVGVTGLCAVLVACAPDGTGGTNNLFSDVSTMSSANTAGLSAEQRALREQQQSYARVRVGAAAGGAALGLVGCMIQNCTPQQRAAAMVAGAAAAYLAGGYLTNQNQQFQATQETLNRDIELAREEVQKLTQSVASAQSVVAFQRSEIARLNQEYSAGTVSEDAYKAQVATMRGDVSATQALIATSTERLGGLDNSIVNHQRAGLPTGQLSAQRTAQQNQLQQLRQTEQAMLANINRAPAAVRS